MIKSIKLLNAIALGLALMLSQISISAAETPDSEAQLEARLRALSSELRCLVCQNSTLADSDADLAEDLRNEIRAQMRAGKSDEEVVSYLVERYGDFVLYRPPMNANTALLWFGPFIMLLIGAIILIVVLKKRASSANADESAPDNDEDLN